MKGSDTELNDLNIPNHNKSSRRSSWYSLASDSSNAQTTMYSAKKITTDDGSIRSNHNLKQSERDTEMPVSNLSHRKSNTPLSSNQSEIEDENDVRPTSDQQATKTSNTEANSPSTSNFVTKFIKAFPPFSQTRRTIKASIALLIATIFILDSNTRAATGESVLLVAIVVIFYFPVRTIGSMGGLLAAAWSFLGSYLASLARDKSNPNPVQPGACSILAVFLFLGTFVLNLIRMKVPKANFGTVIACIVLTFTMTYSASVTPFVPEITWLFLRPVAIAGAISLAVNYFLWPDDSINNFLGVLRKTLGGYNEFFKEHSESFLCSNATPNGASLLSLNSRLKNGLLLMVDCKRAFDTENNYLHSDVKNIYFEHFKDLKTVEAFTTTLEKIKPISLELTNLCYKASNEASVRIGNLHYHPRTTLNSILWPFPRLWVSKSSTVDSIQSNEKVTSVQVQEVLSRFVSMSKSDEVFADFLSMNSSDIPRNGPLHLIFLYIHNLRQHAADILSLTEMVEDLEIKRTRSRLWLPHQTLKKWLLANSEVGATVGPDVNDYSNHAGGNDLVRVSTRQDGRHDDGNDEEDIFQAKRPPNQRQFGDPDVSAPVTVTQKFFYGLHLFGKWMASTNTFFAFKTAVGVVMLAIPAYRPSDAKWYMEWRGQWAMITLVLWMFPMTGAFLFGLIDRVLGSIIGCVAGIVVWEICQGNPYGLAVYRVAALMTTITMLLVIAYEYGYVVEGLSEYDKVWTVAGKRLLLVVIGIAASGILISIPFPPTSRAALRKNISLTIRDIGKAFGVLSATSTSSRGEEASPIVVKNFGKLAMGLRRQIAEERTLLHHTRFEPPLRGYYPASSYTTLVDKMDNMSNLVINMGYSLRQVRPEWRRNIASILMRERKEYLSSMLTTLRLLSSTLSAKTPLPPYMISPIELRQRFVNLLEKKIMIEPKDIADPSFPCYSAYLMNSLIFVDEMQVVLTVVEDLVGVEDPDIWITART
ncbi:unnamed protein product [Mucor hiemalis]